MSTDVQYLRAATIAAIQERCIPVFLTEAGSRLYGTSTPDSDYDVRGICISPPEALIGLNHFEQVESPQDGTEDWTVWALNKFAALALQANPNILEILFAPIEGETCLMVENDWRIFRQVRQACVSKRLVRTHVGMAFAQAKKMATHVEWIAHPPEQPMPQDFGAYHDEVGTVRWGNHQRKQNYDTAQHVWEQYSRWVRERNPERAKDELAHGYDTKNGMNLCRVLLQGEEMLTTGTLKMPRPEAAWLLEVRDGLMNYEEMMGWFKDKRFALEDMALVSKIPAEPDEAQVNGVLQMIQFGYLERICSL